VRKGFIERRLNLSRLAKTPLYLGSGIRIPEYVANRVNLRQPTAQCERDESVGRVVYRLYRAIYIDLFWQSKAIAPKPRRRCGGFREVPREASGRRDSAPGRASFSFDDPTDVGSLNDALKGGDKRRAVQERPEEREPLICGTRVGDVIDREWMFGCAEALHYYFGRSLSDVPKHPSVFVLIVQLSGADLERYSADVDLVYPHLDRDQADTEARLQASPSTGAVIGLKYLWATGCNRAGVREVELVAIFGRFKKLNWTKLTVGRVVRRYD
jgi:hypothetical protein